MKIAFLVERPTQFEAPFYRFAARDPRHELRVLFTGGAGVAGPVFDPELGTAVSWGIDLLGGYPSEVCPATGAAEWLAERLRPKRCDLLIVNGYTQPLYRLGTRLARRGGTATALRLDSVRFGGSSLRDLAKRLLFATYMKRTYDLFFGVGSLTLEYLQAFGVPARRAGLFPYAVDVEEFRQRSRLALAEREAMRARLAVPAAARVVLSLAKFSPREAPWDLLRAFARLEREDLWLVLAGDGPERAALERAAGARVRFPGYVPYPELPALYASADLFVHPAREERWGVSVQEALACGLPVVASSRVGAAFDLVEPGGNGFLYAAGDDAGLAGRIGDALALPAERVREASAAILARWDYAAAWRGLLDAAARVTGGAA
ncbi:MAG TPA: glycosyltransferase [Thermoanaerobaculia bacterium]|jgi:glycosyltransferase involved in cell wall biosynthesis|nr:glycosyltransferase [Thermoanaerobaculia bacterium]